MTKNPILVFTGLAVAAVAGVAGLTRDQWMNTAPQQIAGAELTKTPDTPPPAEQPAATAEAPADPAPATPAAETTAAETPAAASGEQQSAAVQPEQPAPESTAPAVAPVETPAVDPAVAPVETPAVETSEPATPAAPASAEAVKEDVPSFDTVRIEKSGEAVIAGTAEAGSEVVVKLDGEEIGKTVANADGAFVVVPDAPLPSGSGALTIESKGEGDASPTPSEETVAVIVPASEEKQDALVAIVSPNAPTRVLQKPGAEADASAETQVAAADPAAEAPAEPAAAAPAVEQPATAAPAAKPAQLVSIDSVDYDETGNIVFSGRGEPGNGARIYVDNTFVGDAGVGEDGRWSFAGTADIKPGVHTLRVDGIDSNGTVINRVEVPFFREETKKVVASAAPAEQPAETAPDQTVEKTAPEAVPGETEQQTAAAAAADQPETAAPAAPKEGRVVIQPGNNLWRISRVLYGSGTKYTLLYQANKDQIRNPNRIYPGQIFKTPDVSPKSETIDPSRRDPLTPEENAASAQ
jgi:hypothetical protein